MKKEYSSFSLAFDEVSIDLPRSAVLRSNVGSRESFYDPLDLLWED